MISVVDVYKLILTHTSNEKCFMSLISTDYGGVGFILVHHVHTGKLAI